MSDRAVDTPPTRQTYPGAPTPSSVQRETDVLVRDATLCPEHKRIALAWRDHFPRPDSGEWPSHDFSRMDSRTHPIDRDLSWLQKNRGEVQGTIDVCASGRSRQCTKKALGNGVVPRQLAQAWLHLTDQLSTNYARPSTKTGARQVATDEQTREILEHRTAINRAAITAYVDALDSPPPTDRASRYAAVAKGLHAALLAVAAGWMAEAEIVNRQMRRGWKSRGEALEAMATQLRGVAGGMLSPALTAGLADEQDGIAADVAGVPIQQPVSDLATPTRHCAECLDPGEDPRPWCDCADGETCSSLVGGESCRHRAHDPLQCPTLPRTAPDRAEHCKICEHKISGYVSDRAQCDKGCVCSTVLCWPVPDDEPDFVTPTGPTIPPAEFVTPDGKVITDDITAYLKGDTDVIPTTPAFVEPAPVAPHAAPTTTPQFVDAAVGPKRLSWDEVATLAESVRLPSAGSFTTITSLAECGLAYLLDRAAKYQMDNAPMPQPAWWNVAGEAFHAGIERIERGYLTGNVIEPNDLATVWGECFGMSIEAAKAESGHGNDGLWRAANKGAEGYDWWRVQGEAYLRSYMRYWDDVKRGEWAILILPDGSPAIEIDLTLDVEGWPFRCRIDQAWWNRKHGFIRIVDPKSGSTRQPGTFQLGGYAHALASLLTNGNYLAARPDLGEVNRLTIAGAYYDARKASHDWETPDLLARHPWAEIKMRSNAARSILSQRAFLPRVSVFGGGCSSCAHKGVCPTQGS